MVQKEVCLSIHLLPTCLASSLQSFPKNPFRPGHHGSRPTLPLTFIPSTPSPTTTGYPNLVSDPVVCPTAPKLFSLLLTPLPALPTLSPLGPSPRPEATCLSPAPPGRPRESSVCLQVRTPGFSWRQRWLRLHHWAPVLPEVPPTLSLLIGATMTFKYLNPLMTTPLLYTSVASQSS